MALTYQENGNLAIGLHHLNLEELISEYGYTAQRPELINGLKVAIRDLNMAGCKQVFIDGSFVSKKFIPNDYDACWSAKGMNINLLRQQFPLFFDFGNHRARQKAYYKGEWFPAYGPAQINPIVWYINFFQRDREDNPKGIVGLQI